MKWKVFLLITALSTAAFANSFRNSFHFDDQHYIVENPYIRDISNVPSFFISPGYSSFEQVFTSHYRPLLVTSYAVNYVLGGLRPEGYHAVNLLFHTGSAFIVYLILASMLSVCCPEMVSVSQPGRTRNNSVMTDAPAAFTALAAALVFAVHPFNSEVVNYISARSSVMCAFFYLLSFYCWIRFRLLNGRAGLYYFASLTAFVLAMLTKEIAITLPAAIFLYDLYFHRRQAPGRRQISLAIKSSISGCLPIIPFFVFIIAPYLIYRLNTYGSITGGGRRDYLTNFLTQPMVLLKYIQLVFLPAGLTIEHDISLSGNYARATVILSVASIPIILFAAYLLFKRGREWKVLSFFILWFFITLLPTTIIPLNAVLQENRGYLGGMAAPVFAGLFVSRLRRRVKLPVLVIVIILLFSLTIQRNFVWRSNLSLWSDAVAKSPVSARAHDNLGLAWMEEKKYDLAIKEFNRTLELNRRYYLAYYNAGVAYQLQGDFEKAKMSYIKSLDVNPEYFRSWYNLGIVYRRLGELDQAVASYDKAIVIDPRHPFVYNNLGVVLTEMGEYKRAVGVFKMAVTIDPEYEKAYYNLGNVFFRNREYGKAAEAYRAAVRIRPDYTEASGMLKEATARQKS